MPAAALVGAWALDVCSGVEAAPGRKDDAKLGAFFEALRPEARDVRMSGRFGAYGGFYVPEILVPALEQLEAAFLDAQAIRRFRRSSPICSPNMPAGRRRSLAAATSARARRGST
jgi:hypothetical protein